MFVYQRVVVLKCFLICPIIVDPGFHRTHRTSVSRTWLYTKHWGISKHWRVARNDAYRHTRNPPLTKAHWVFILLILCWCLLVHWMEPPRKNSWTLLPSGNLTQFLLDKHYMLRVSRILGCWLTTSLCGKQKLNQQAENGVHEKNRPLQDVAGGCWVSLRDELENQDFARRSCWWYTLFVDYITCQSNSPTT